ncbi:MAG: M20/M25/M40 family metallo-hydrolase [Thiogranum sp.]
MRQSILFFLSGLTLLAACTEDIQHKNITTLIGQIDELRLRNHVTALTETGPRPADDAHATRRTADYIRAQLSSFGYQPFAEGPDRVQNRDTAGFANIIAERAGSTASGSVLEVGAHYDTVAQSPGADDNASGVAAVLEVARILSQARVIPTIRFCFFAREEDGRDGSRYHVQQIRKRNEPLDGAIILEMVGYATQEPDTQGTPARIPWLFSPPTTGNFVAVAGNLPSGGLGNRFERALATYVPTLPLLSANRVGGFFRDALRSDHKPYWDNGYRAIMLTDTANFRNPHYHQPDDTPDTLDYRFLRRITQATAATLLAAGR